MKVNYPITVEDDSPFPLENIPFGVFSTESNPQPRIATIIGQYVLDLKVLAVNGLFKPEEASTNATLDVKHILSETTLNEFASKSLSFRSFIRNAIIDLLSDPKSTLFQNEKVNENAFVSVQDAKMHLPMRIGGFTDFLCSDVHALNCSNLTGNPIYPSFYAFPTAYNGRASSVVISGTPVKRPRGMVKTSATTYGFEPSARFDFELEFAAIVSSPIPYGEYVTSDEAAANHIFGFVLLNDWSSRDIQFAEMQPLGPFNGKGTATTISPWVVVPEALQHAQCGSSHAKVREEMSQHPVHLQHKSDNLDTSTFDIDLEVTVIAPNSTPTTLCRSNVRHLYWTPAQMIAHHSSSGCGLQTGDLIASGTVSGPGHTPEKPTLGCLFELTDGWKKPVSLPGGREMMVLADGDEIVLSAWANGKVGKRIGFGDARGVVLPV